MQKVPRRRVRAHGAQTALPHTFSSSTADTCNTNRDNLTTDRRTHSQRAPLGPSTRGPAPRLRPLRVRRWTDIAYPCRPRALHAHRHYRSATAARAVSCEAPTPTEPPLPAPACCHPCFAARRVTNSVARARAARAPRDTPRARHAAPLPQVHGNLRYSPLIQGTRRAQEAQAPPHPPRHLPPAAAWSRSEDPRPRWASCP